MSSQATASISNQASWTKALLWKEVRQVMPLMLTVLGMGFGILLIILITAAFGSNKGIRYETGFWFLFLSMPMMYATGVGILLVGNEKESRSMLWMRTLPVGAKHIAWNKLVVALVSLAVVWLIALTSWAIFATSLGAPLSVVGAFFNSGNETNGWLLPDYLMVSVFLCLAGLAFAWRFESQILSLVLLIPAALAIWLPSYGISKWLDGRGFGSASQSFLDSGVYLVGLTIGSIVALVYGWRVSQKALSALAAPSQASGAAVWSPAIFGQAAAGGARSEARLAEAWSLWPSVTPLGGMLWQMIRQNGIWWSLIGLLSLIVLGIGSGCDIKGSTDTIDQDWILKVLFPLGFLSGLLGVLAFQSDGIQQRVRFYADRGVSPTLLWLTRHWIPVTVVLVLAIARHLSLRLAPWMNSPWIFIDTAAVLGVCLAAYIVGQWVSQFVKSPILSAIVLPAVLLTNLAYCIFAVAAMEAPWWLLIASFAITAFSTWWMMKPWMERRIDWKYYLQHSLFSLAAMLIPLIPGLWKIWNLPTMPSDVRANLQQLAMKAPSSQRMQKYLSSNYLTSIDKIDQDAIPLVLSHNEEIREYQQGQVLGQVVDPEYWLANGDPTDLLKIYLAQLASLQNSLMSSQVDSKMDMEVSLRKYRDAMADLPKVVTGLRATRRLRLCDIAEQIELSALGHCKHSKAREWMGAAAYESVARFLGDDQARDESRRVALATAWWEPKQNLNTNRPDLYFGLDGYPTQYFVGMDRRNQSPSIPSSMGVLRGRDLYVADLWRLLELPTGSQQAAAHRELIDSRNAYASHTPADGRFIVLSHYPFLSPAGTWRGEWEVLAKKLLTEVNGQ